MEWKEVNNENQSADSGNPDSGRDGTVSDHVESVVDAPESDVSDKSPAPEQSEAEPSEPSGEGDAGESTEGSTGEETGQSGESEPESESESEEGAEDSSESGTGEGETEEPTEPGTEESTEEQTEEQTETGTGDSREAGTVEQEGGIYTGSLSQYLEEQGYTETGEIAACMEVIHQDNLQIHNDLQLIVIYLTGFVVLSMFYVMYRILRIFI